tara:strand:- start:1062 stop:1175 length:114 start_codon:yes stop_codon:yes gene_type:complete
LGARASRVKKRKGKKRGEIKGGGRVGDYVIVRVYQSQ